MTLARHALGAFACALGLSTLVSCGHAEEATETRLDSAPAPEIGGLGVRENRAFRLSGLKGTVVLLSFGYTSCVEVCPDTFLKAKGVFRTLGDPADLEFVYVTVDPERDRPEPFRAFLASVDPRFEGVYLESAELSPVLAAYHVTARKRLPDPQRYARRNVDPAAFYTMDHTSGFWLVDREGRLRVRYRQDVSAEALADGARRLLAERS